MIAKGEPTSAPFRDLIATYVHVARHYEKKALIVLKKILPQLESRYQLSLMIIHALYLQILERVSAESGDFAFDEVSPSPDDVRKRIEETIATFQAAI
jgi:hypothetical protein